MLVPACRRRSRCPITPTPRCAPGPGTSGSMATFVLIHGSWHGGWCFDEVKALLEAAGHRVIAPDLPGMGGTEAELGAVTLQGWADFVAGLCRDAPQRPVVLAGHSRGGLVIGQDAETAPEAI